MRRRTPRLVPSIIALLTLAACEPGASVPPRDGGPPDTGPPPVDAFRPDAGRSDAGPTAEFGQACRSSAACESGFCVDTTGTGGVCTRECDEGCPDDWSCRSVDVAGETRSLCVPLLGDHCVRCASDSECVGGACLAIDGARHCAPRCTDDEGCPTGYRCEAEGEGRYCRPLSGSCTCTAAMAGATRSCANVNELGTCLGTQTCGGAEGWSSCDAREAAAEVCNGMDDDCDFVVDDGLDTGESCANTIEGVGTCPGVQVCGGAGGFVCQGQTPEPERCNYLDDDCDGDVDEDYPDVGTLCTVGRGACLSVGAIRCRAEGTGTECSAVAGAPTAERCNGRDDDCDGNVDEDFPTLGRGCGAGVGACERFGTVVCRADELAAECSATPGPSGAEICNYLDDDCNGEVDDGFRDPATRLYDRDGTCGSCDIDCRAIFAGTPNAVGTCSLATGAPVCVLRCAPGTFDLNGATQDGCEFVLDEAVIFVSRTDPAATDSGSCGLGPAGTGAGRFPCASIERGLARAATTGRRAVWVADGSYDEPAELRNGIDLLGGFRADTWEREATSTATLIQGVSSDGVHDRTVVASGITMPTLFEGFIVQGSFNARPSGNSYAVYISDSGAGLRVRGNFIYAGRGGSGAPGVVGTNGARGTDGTGRNSPGIDPALYDARVTTGAVRCDASNNRTFTNGGATSCGGDDVAGGRGGGVTCPPSASRIQQSASNGQAGQPGGGPGGAAGAGGAGGFDGELIRVSGGVSCLVPSAPGTLFGEDGANGSSGVNGTAVSGCAAPTGGVLSGHWRSGAATAGRAGSPAGGGGGGGAGGGGACSDCDEGRDRLGGVGGGGGAGGCGGAGGGAGGAGGGAFGIFVVGGAPELRDNFILQGDGGVGGRGGQGGAGGFGGVGGDGGMEMNCGGRGGRGGDGGAGGHGSGGGGGCGGPSFGIYTAGVSAPPYCTASSANAIVGGTAGPGGAGGLSPGVAGGVGAAGVVQACRFE